MLRVNILLWQHWIVGMQAAAEQYIHTVQGAVAADPHGQPGVFKMGFHSIPSMPQLHMHIISQVMPIYTSITIGMQNSAMLCLPWCLLCTYLHCMMQGKLGFVVSLHTNPYECFHLKQHHRLVCLSFNITSECMAQCKHASMHLSCVQHAGFCVSFTEEQEALEFFHHRLFH